jgi:putative endonuclease
MSFEGKELGQRAEDLAADFLRSKKFKILKQNLRTKYGEIDILAKEGKTIVVVEVKAKTSSKFGSAIEMITPAKQAKLVLLTNELQAKYQTDNVRIDVVAVDDFGTEPKIRHYKGIIELKL